MRRWLFLHPFHNWWNDKTPMVMGTGLILWLMGVSYFLTYYRDYHFGKEHGTLYMQSMFEYEWLESKREGQEWYKQEET